MDDTPYIHQFASGVGSSRTTLIMLHGSGGDERTLLPLAKRLAPDLSVLAIRGTVCIDGGHAFFHRFPDRSIDEADLSARVPILADFIETCQDRYGIGDRPIVVGYSNGAIMAAALLMTRPSLLRGAILLRPLSPFASDPRSDLSGVPVLVIDGAKDTRRLPGDGARLVHRLQVAGAMVTHHVLVGGHSISDEDVELARTWLGAIMV